MGRTLTQKDAGVFIQFQPGKQSYYLGDCIDLDGIPNPRLGGIDPIYCWNARRDGYIEKGIKLSPPGRIEFTVSELVEQAASWLEKVNCAFTFFALRATCGERGVFNNWERGHVVANTRILDDTQNNVAHHVDDNEAMHEYNLSGAIPRMDVWPMVSSRKTTAEVNALNDVTGCGNLFCGDECGAQTDPCDIFYAVAAAAVGATANVMKSINQGVTWAATGTDPFAINEDLVAVACFEIARGTNRVIVVRETDAAAPLELAYSDDGGATWTLVTVGSTNAEALGSANGLFVLDSQHLWLATTAGEVFFSSDGGETWAAQGATSASGATQLNAIHFVDASVGFAVGNTDVVIKTVDGGAHWTAATATGGGDNLLSVWAFSKYRVLIGSAINATGSLYMSFDGAATYEVKYFTGYATEGVKDIYFFNSMRGVIVTNTAGPVGSIHETIDGGHEWKEISLPSNSGLNALVMCEMNTALAVGAPNGGTAAIVALGAY